MPCRVCWLRARCHSVPLWFHHSRVQIQLQHCGDSWVVACFPLFFFLTKEEVNSAAIAFQTTILDGVLVAARRAPAPIKAHRVHGWNANGTAQCGLLRGHHGAPFLPMPEQPDCHSHPMMGGSPGSTLFLGQFLSFQPKAAIQERSFGSQLPPAAPAALRHVCVCACP